MKKTLVIVVLMSLMFASVPAVLATTTVKWTLRDGDARYFADPPDVVAYANVTINPPPEGVTITMSEGLWLYSGWVPLEEKDDWIQATFSGTHTKLGVQLWGHNNANAGWARVLVDGEEVWTGNTDWSDLYISDKYLEIYDLEPKSHTIRVECMGIKGTEQGGDDVSIVFFGFSYPPPTQYFTIKPDTLYFTAHKTMYGTTLVTDTNNPSGLSTSQDVKLTANETDSVKWSSNGPSWVGTSPLSGKTPSVISVSAVLTVDDVKKFGFRTGEEVYTSDDGKMKEVLEIKLTIAPPRYVNPIDVNPKEGDKSQFFEYIKSRGYRKVVPLKSELPPGSIIFWEKVGSPDYRSHVTLVFDATKNHIGMEKSNKILPHLTKPVPPGGGEYVLMEVWEPPTISSFDKDSVPSVLLEEGKVSRESGLRYWNCHGFVLNVIFHGIKHNMIIKPGADAEINDEDLMVNYGEAWFYEDEGRKMNIIVPPGEILVQSEGLVNVHSDDSVTFYLFEGSADYSGGGYTASLESKQKVNISPNGEPGPVEPFDPAEIEAWWEQIIVEPGKPPTNIYLPVVFKSAGAD